MERLLGVLFLALWLSGVIVVWVSSADMPVRVAAQFGAGGVARGWQSLESYRSLMVSLTALLPLLIVVCMAWLPRGFTNRMGPPLRERLMSPELREQTLRAIAGIGFACGCLILGFLVGLHLLVVAANEARPPRLAEPEFFVLLGVFVGGLLLTILGGLWRLLRR